MNENLNIMNFPRTDYVVSFDVEILSFVSVSDFQMFKRVFSYMFETFYLYFNELFSIPKVCKIF